jgi:glucose-1-phosphate adenylyltransferase
MLSGYIAMILAGGRGERLGSLTSYYSKPAVPFGGNKRIIDFTLHNCIASGINTVGILSQHFSEDLHLYINNTYNNSGFFMLPSNLMGNFYEGTADAVHKNIGFIDRYNPESVLILAGDHIYNMDYKKMIDFHAETQADVTVASTPVPIKEASKFGIINADESGRITGFEEKPQNPKTNLASMGIYVFKWSVLRYFLISDYEDIDSQHDFGRNILPVMLRSDRSMFTYKFNGYWRDVGTLESLWEANMELINDKSTLENWQTSDSYIGDKSNFISDRSSVNNSVMHGRCSIFGKVEHSVLSDSVTVRQNSEISNSIVMPNVYIGHNVRINNAIIGTGAVIRDNIIIGGEEGIKFLVETKLCSGGISLVAPYLHIPENMKFKGGSHINGEMLQEWIERTDINA